MVFCRAQLGFGACCFAFGILGYHSRLESNRTHICEIKAKVYVALYGFCLCFSIYFLSMVEISVCHSYLSGLPRAHIA